jgi:hypothetical protein
VDYDQEARKSGRAEEQRIRKERGRITRLHDSSAVQKWPDARPPEKIEVRKL